MRALTVDVSSPGSVAVTEVPEPAESADLINVRGIALGICGTDREIGAGDYGWAPQGESRLILGHESLGEVIDAPTGSGFAAGDLVVGVVRRPDPLPCGACAHGDFDMCRRDDYVERGIKERHGFGSERWTIEPDYAVKVDASLGELGVLVEPTSVVAKAWEQIELVGGRSWFEPKRVLVAGAGPIGLLAALLGVQRGLEVHLTDLFTEGPKPEVAAALEVGYHSSGVAEVTAKLRPDIVIEATGVSEVVFESIAGTGSYGIVCLTGVPPTGRKISVDVGSVSRAVVLENDAIIGTVSANLRHYTAAAEALKAADPAWLRRLITRRLPIDEAVEAFSSHNSSKDIKTVVEL